MELWRSWCARGSEKAKEHGSIPVGSALSWYLFFKVNTETSGS